MKRHPAAVARKASHFAVNPIPSPIPPPEPTFTRLPYYISRADARAQGISARPRGRGTRTSWLFRVTDP